MYINYPMVKFVMDKVTSPPITRDTASMQTKFREGRQKQFKIFHFIAFHNNLHDYTNTVTALIATIKTTMNLEWKDSRIPFFRPFPIAVFLLFTIFISF